MAIKHTKTNNIADPTQAELDAQIALGNYPPGTLLADITLSSDWNASHSISLTKAEFDTACSDGNFLYAGDVTSSQWTTTGSDIYYNTGSVAIGAANANSSALLDMVSTTKGFGLPAMTNAQTSAIASPRAGLMTYNTGISSPSFWDGTQWLGLYVPYLKATFFDPAYLRFAEATSNGTNYVQLTVAASMTGDAIITLPQTTGTMIVSAGKQTYDATNTAAGTTGAQTINKPSGTVNFAAAATSLVVTNSLCTTSSIVFATIRTNDATATIKNVVPAAGSFTITLGAAATAETSVGFFIIN